MKITANIEEFLSVFVQFDTDTLRPLAVYYLNNTIVWAVNNWDLKCFGGQINHIIYLMTAHRVFLGSQSQSGQAGQGGRVASANVDSVSVSYSPMPSRDSFTYWLSLSPYGQELAAMLEMLDGLPKYYGGSFERVF